MKKIFLNQRIWVAVLGALIMLMLTGTDMMQNASYTLADALYQRPTFTRDDIIIIGIDQRAVDLLGPTPWPRDIMAQALEYLNADAELAPAVIGLDVTYIGDGADAAADARLAAAAQAHGNVITSATATFGTQLVTTADGDFYVDDFAVLAFEQSYDALREVTTIGHVNAMLDGDGILRHAIWQIDLPDGTVVPSFHAAIYERYVQLTDGILSDPPQTDARHNWYVPFSAPPGSFYDGFSVADLIEGTIDRRFFDGKIVLIGPYAQGMQDDYTTAIDHATKMYGVEYQANAIAALLNGTTKVELLSGPQNVLAVLAAALCMLWFYERSVKVATISWALLTAAWIGICVTAYEFGYVLQVFFVPFAVSAAFVVSVATNYVRAALERRRVTLTFRRYVAPEIVSELLEGDENAMQLGGKTSQIAVLFVDVRGFTPMAEVLDAQEVVELLNSYLTLTAECIFRYHGTLDKYVGDCTMAFWGAPLEQEDCVFKAVKAGLDMLEQSKTLSGELEKKYGRSMQFGIGVHFGPAVVGNIGSPARMDYTAIGDTVNTASRLEGNAPPGQMYVSRAVADELKGRVRFTSLGTDMVLKGKSADFETLRVDGLALGEAEK